VHYTRNMFDKLSSRTNPIHDYNHPAQRAPPDDLRVFVTLGDLFS
jgi:hypothetical protein